MNKKEKPKMIKIQRLVTVIWLKTSTYFRSCWPQISFIHFFTVSIFPFFLKTVMYRKDTVSASKNYQYDKSFAHTSFQFTQMYQFSFQNVRFDTPKYSFLSFHICLIKLKKSYIFSLASHFKCKLYEDANINVDLVSLLFYNA